MGARLIRVCVYVTVTSNFVARDEHVERTHQWRGTLEVKPTHLKCPRMHTLQRQNRNADHVGTSGTMQRQEKNMVARKYGP